MTGERKAQLNALYRMMCERTVTQDDVMIAFGVGRRLARDMISEVAKVRPVISLSDRRGYRVAMKIEDMCDARHALAEIRSRQSEMERRALMLEKFLEGEETA